MGPYLKSVRVTTAAELRPVTLEEAKSHLRVDAATDDTLINIYIAAAAQWAENFTRRAIINTTFEANYSRFQDEFELPHGKTQSVTSITYVDTAGVRQTLTGADASPVGTGFQQDLSSDEGGRIMAPYGSTWPSTRWGVYKAVSINYVAGFGSDFTAVPDDIRHAILLKVADSYEIRATLDLMQEFHDRAAGKAAEALLRPYQITRYA